jgi:uncharacterized protein DUF3108
MRSVIAVACVAACTGPAGFHPAALPELVPSKALLKPIAAPALLLAPGEHLIYDVHVHGMTIGRAEIEVGDTEVRSRFKTDSLAEMVMSVEHELTTMLDRGGARAGASVEMATIGGEVHHFETSWQGSTMTLNGVPSPLPPGIFGQTVHSALGLLRAWAAPDASPGFVMVLVMGKLYRLDVMRPTVEELQGTKTLRIDGRVGAKQPMTFVMWLEDAPAHTPLRIELDDDDAKVIAELVRS